MESSARTDFRKSIIEQQSFALAVESIVTEAYKPYIIFLWTWLVVIQVTVIIYTVILVIQWKRNMEIDQQMSEVEAAVKFHHQLCQNTVRLRNQGSYQENQRSIHQNISKPELVVVPVDDKRDNCNEVIQAGHQNSKGLSVNQYEIADDNGIDITIERTRTVHIERVCNVEDSTEYSPPSHGGDGYHSVS